MKRAMAVLAVIVLAAGLVPAFAQPVPAPETEKWLHVRVEQTQPKNELVRVNVPLALAEKVLPAIHNGRLHDGKVTVDQARIEGVDLRAVLDAVKNARDGEFVTIQSTENDVRVAKEAGYLLVHVRENRKATKPQVEVRVPMTVVDALLSSGTNELDLVAAIRALAAHGDTELVRVKDERSTVRVWVDSKNVSE
jgi:hypothetical protein